MSEHTAPPPFEAPDISTVRERARMLAGYWWFLLVAGIAWIVVALVILQFDAASLTTIGILVGLMFGTLGIENLTLATLDAPMRWLHALFGVLFLGAAIACFASPTDTFAGLADMLGFLFLIVGVWWMVRAFLERAINPLWWVGLISGILMTVARLLDRGPVLHREGVRAADLRRDLGAGAGHHRHRPCLRRARRARRALAPRLLWVSDKGSSRRQTAECPEAAQRPSPPGATNPSSRARATASLRVCASSFA